MQKNKIIEKKGKDFYLEILNYTEVYSEKWQLFDFEFVEYFSFNAIFFCKSELYGDCVLKIYSEDFEYDTLCEYNGRCFVKAFEYENDIILMERAIPGKMLRDEPSLEKRLSVFSDLFNGLHIEPKNPEIYGAYANWVINMADYVINKPEDNKELYAHALKAKEIYLEMVSSVYNKKSLIHGDLHCDNIISCGNGKYKIIDPLSYIGDPVFETGRYISQEYRKADSEKRLKIVAKISDHFEKSLNIPKRIVKQCFYIDIIIHNCTVVENGFTATIDDVRFAEIVLNEIE
jgi:streptomycin 6-kinase